MKQTLKTIIYYLKSEGIKIIASKSGFDSHRNIKLISTSQALIHGFKVLHK